MTTWHPLTEAARGIYFATQLDPENPCYNTAECVEFAPGAEVDAGVLRRALLAVYAENEGFRARFASRGTEPVWQALPLADFEARVRVLRPVELPDPAAASASAASRHAASDAAPHRISSGAAPHRTGSATVPPDSAAVPPAGAPAAPGASPQAGRPSPTRPAPPSWPGAARPPTRPSTWNRAGPSTPRSSAAATAPGSTTASTTPSPTGSPPPRRCGGPGACTA
ncbi:hypothetical protein NBM05_00490 [Rothia sp. AR01]|uniref:Condensation domain-containing protein n=1 Tax=Rothia santali TaxID=2949643 RepID=A0A9X2H8A8_9MICC|nr:hypothetical protein [Rothia santali]MCP3424551.1 hypothetical protein [Rothia santali]